VRVVNDVCVCVGGWHDNGCVCVRERERVIVGERGREKVYVCL
jgi:hypothetical protein